MKNWKNYRKLQKIRKNLTLKLKDSSGFKVWLYPMVHNAIQSSTDSPFLASSKCNCINCAKDISSSWIPSFLLKFSQSSSCEAKQKHIEKFPLFARSCDTLISSQLTYWHTVDLISRPHKKISGNWSPTQIKQDWNLQLIALDNIKQNGQK